MLKLIRNAEVYAPAPLGWRDILVAGDKIMAVEADLSAYAGLPHTETYDFSGLTITPGLIDLHVHITGGGGEQGPASRTPEIKLSEITLSGVTTVLGLLGTDGVTRSLDNLIAKAYALQERGLDTVDANVALGFPPDLRDYGLGAQIIADLGIRKIRLLTNNPQKVAALSGYGLEICERVPLEFPAGAANENYLRVKQERMGHWLHANGAAPAK
jgi:hypothetical protein